MSAEWIEVAKKNAMSFLIGIGIAAVIAVPMVYRVQERADKLHEQERTFHATQLKQVHGNALTEANRENTQRRIANLEADNARLRDALKNTQADLAQALAEDADAQDAKTALQRDQQLRQKLDAYVDQAVALTTALDADTITGDCEHYAAWNELIALRNRIAIEAPRLHSGAQNYTNWLQQSALFVEPGMAVPNCNSPSEEAALRKEATKLIAQYNALMSNVEIHRDRCAKEAAEKAGDPLIDRIHAIGRQLRNGQDLVTFAEPRIRTIGGAISDCENQHINTAASAASAASITATKR